MIIKNYLEPIKQTVITTISNLIKLDLPMNTGE